MNQSEDRSRPPGFVVFSDDWGMHPSSCQHLFRHISRSHHVGWINTIGMRPPSVSWTDARKIVEKASRMLSRPRDDTPSADTANVEVFQPAMLPYVIRAAHPGWHTASSSMVSGERRESWNHQ